MYVNLASNIEFRPYFSEIIYIFFIDISPLSGFNKHKTNGHVRTNYNLETLPLDSSLTSF